MKAIMGVLGVGIILFILLPGNLDGLQEAFAYNQSESDTVQEEKVQQEENHEITYEEITQLTNEFMDILVQDTDMNYKVINYNTKEELLNAFEEVSTSEVAKVYVDSYYMEEADGLYIKATETPPWFMEENDYDIVQVDENTVKIVQDNYSDLNGNYTVEFEFTYDKDWKITKITHA